MLSHFLTAVIKSGDLCLIDARGRDWRFGDGTAPHVTIQIHDKATQWRLMLNPQLSVGEAYMKGSLTIERGTRCRRRSASRVPGRRSGKGHRS